MGGRGWGDGGFGGGQGGQQGGWGGQQGGGQWGGSQQGGGGRGGGRGGGFDNDEEDGSGGVGVVEVVNRAVVVNKVVGEASRAAEVVVEVVVDGEAKRKANKLEVGEEVNKQAVVAEGAEKMVVVEEVAVEEVVVAEEDAEKAEDHLVPDNNIKM
uniref:Uncharacterized protein n=1 Tax=Ditylenchus dipsaci TaxID=166011 RepID=A0A915DF92_9BILA